MWKIGREQINWNEKLKDVIPANFGIRNTMVITIFEHFQKKSPAVTSQGSPGPKLGGGGGGEVAFKTRSPLLE